MKNTFILLIIASMAAGCSSEPNNSTDEVNTTEISAPNGSSRSSNAPSSDKETSIEVTFGSGEMKGTHVFKPMPNDYASQINVNFDKGVSTLSAIKLISEDGKYQFLITRPILGEATKGSHDAKHYTNDCGTFKLRSLADDAPISTIRGKYKNCTKTTVSDCGNWIEIALSDGSTRTETTKIEVLYKGMESRLMQK